MSPFFRTYVVRPRITNIESIEKEGDSYVGICHSCLCCFAPRIILGEWRPSRKKEILFLCLSSVVLIVFSALRATNVGIDYYQFYVPFLKMSTAAVGGFWSVMPIHISQNLDSAC